MAPRKHSPIGPSSSDRWMACAGSVPASEGEPNNDTFFTRQGTAAHTFVEFIMRTGAEPSDYLDGVVLYNAPSLAEHIHEPGDLLAPEPDEWDSFPIDDEMVEGAELWRDVIGEHYKPEEGDEIVYETRLDMSHVHPLLFGTGDLMVYKPRQKWLIVGDYKYGRGYAVERTTPQLKVYDLGGVHRYRDRGVEKVTNIIVQPRAYHLEGPVRKLDLTIEEVEQFEQEVREAAARTDDPLAERIAGAHCKWCPASYHCETLRTKVREIIGSYASDDQEPVEDDLPKVMRLSPEQLGRIVREVSIIEGWLRRVMSHAHSEAMDGRVPAGLKLVEKRAYRIWTSQAKAQAALEKAGVDEDDFMEEPKFKSVAKIEKLLGKKKARAILEGDPALGIDPLFTKKSSGYVLAPIEDDREAVDLHAKHSFAAADED